MGLRSVDFFTFLVLNNLILQVRIMDALIQQSALVRLRVFLSLLKTRTRTILYAWNIHGQPGASSLRVALDSTRHSVLYRTRASRVYLVSSKIGDGIAFSLQAGKLTHGLHQAAGCSLQLSRIYQE